MARLLFIFLIFIAGCATTANYEAKLNSWVGSNESSLISSWGAPDNAYQMSNGKRVIEYSRGQNVQMGGYTYTEPQTTYHQGYVGSYNYFGTSTQYVTRQTPVYNIPLWCKTSFIISSDGTIENWRWEGNNCVAYKDPTIITSPKRNRGTSRQVENRVADTVFDEKSLLETRGYIKEYPDFFGINDDKRFHKEKYWHKMKDDTMVYFSTQEELDKILENEKLEKKLEPNKFLDSFQIVK